jgi:hypothetical protein
LSRARGVAVSDSAPAQLWVLPVFQHVFKPRQTPFHHRLRMCELGLAGAGVRVLDSERSVCEASAKARLRAVWLSCAPCLTACLRRRAPRPAARRSAWGAWTC